jgi:hypothetical protein
MMLMMKQSTGTVPGHSDSAKCRIQEPVMTLPLDTESHNTKD